MILTQTFVTAVLVFVLALWMRSLAEVYSRKHNSNWVPLYAGYMSALVAIISGIVYVWTDLEVVDLFWSSLVMIVWCFWLYSWSVIDTRDLAAHRLSYIVGYVSSLVAIMVAMLYIWSDWW